MTIKVWDYYQWCKVVEIDWVLYFQSRWGLRVIEDRKDRPQSRSDKVIYDCDMEAARLAEQLCWVRALTSRDDRLQVRVSDYVYSRSDYITDPYRIEKPIVIEWLMYINAYNQYTYILDVNYWIVLIPWTFGNKKIIDRIHELKSIRDYEEKLQYKQYETN